MPTTTRRPTTTELLWTDIEDHCQRCGSANINDEGRCEACNFKCKYHV